MKTIKLTEKELELLLSTKDLYLCNRGLRANVYADENKSKITSLGSIVDAIVKRNKL